MELLLASRAERALISTPHVSPLGPHYAARSAKALGHAFPVRPLGVPARTPPPEEAGDSMACITNLHHHRQSCNKRRAGRSLNLNKRQGQSFAVPHAHSVSRHHSLLIYCDRIYPTLLQAVMIACTLLSCPPSELWLQEPAKPATISALQRSPIKRRLFPLTE